MSHSLVSEHGLCRGHLTLCPGCPELPVPISAPDSPEDFSFSVFFNYKFLKEQTFFLRFVATQE